MSRVLGAFLACFLIVNFLNAKVTQGVDYIVLDEPLPDRNGVLTKVYRYNCPFCYSYDRLVIDKVMAGLDGVKFEAMHLNLGASYGELASQVMAVMIAKDRENGVDILDKSSNYKKSLFSIYNSVFEKKEKFDENSKKSRAKFLKTALAGMSESEFEKRVESKEVAEILATWGLDESGNAAKIAGVQGVPAFVVNGKYLIKASAIKNVDRMVEIIKELKNLN